MIIPEEKENLDAVSGLKVQQHRQRFLRKPPTPNITAELRYWWSQSYWGPICEVVIEEDLSNKPALNHMQTNSHPVVDPSLSNEGAHKVTNLSEKAADAVRLLSSAYEINQRGLIRLLDVLSRSWIVRHVPNWLKYNEHLSANLL